MQPYSSTDTATALKNSPFILSERSDFHLLVNLSTAVHAFLLGMFIPFSIDKTMLLRYLNLPAKFSGLPFNVDLRHLPSKEEMALCGLCGTQ